MRALAATNACRSSLLGSLLLHSLFVWKSQVNLKGASVSISLRAGWAYLLRERGERTAAATNRREREREIKSIGAVRRGIWALFCFVFRFLLLHSFICELSLAFLRLLSLSTLPSPLSLSFFCILYRHTRFHLFFLYFLLPVAFALSPK